MTEKVKAYGERKKNLITPPRPLRERAEPAVATEEEPSWVAEPEPPDVRIVPPERANAIVQRPKEDPPVLFQEPAPVEAVVSTVEAEPAWKEAQAPEISAPAAMPPPARVRQEVPPPDLWYQDLQSLPPVLPASSALPLFFWRRTAALLVDSIIFVILCYAALFGCAWILNSPPGEVVSRYPWHVAGGAAFLHAVYYLYFYSTSRQTPGQLFFSLELRSCGSRNVPFYRVFTRWLAMVLLNILNLIPVFAAKKTFLMDVLSGTEIRSLK